MVQDVDQDRAGDRQGGACAAQAGVRGRHPAAAENNRCRSKKCAPTAAATLGEDAALLYDVVATAELDAARTPPSTSDDDDADALALMALSRS